MVPELVLAEVPGRSITGLYIHKHDRGQDSSKHNADSTRTFDSRWSVLNPGVTRKSML